MIFVLALFWIIGIIQLSYAAGLVLTNHRFLSGILAALYVVAVFAGGELLDGWQNTTKNGTLNTFATIAYGLVTAALPFLLTYYLLKRKENDKII